MRILFNHLTWILLYRLGSEQKFCCLLMLLSSGKVIEVCYSRNMKCAIYKIDVFIYDCTTRLSSNDYICNSSLFILNCHNTDSRVRVSSFRNLHLDLYKACLIMHYWIKCLEERCWKVLQESYFIIWLESYGIV
jgi:hypothetical protein